MKVNSTGKQANAQKMAKESERNLKIKQEGISIVPSKY
jgi:hypothetical protein